MLIHKDVFYGENMSDPSIIIFSTAYLPPIDYMVWASCSRSIRIDIHENYIKQTFRNRCEISSANGKLSLSIPVTKINGNHTMIKDIKIDNSEKWQLNHWRAIVSAYNQSPFFLFYKDDLMGYFEKEFKFLIDFNTQLLFTIFRILKLNVYLEFSDKYIKLPNYTPFDLRKNFSPKKPSCFKFIEYRQVFMDRMDFQPNLSIIDLLFNIGNNSFEYLQSLEKLNNLK